MDNRHLQCQIQKDDQDGDLRGVLPDGVRIPMYNEREVRRFQLTFSPVAADSHYYHCITTRFCNWDIGITGLHSCIRMFHLQMRHLAVHCFDSSSWEFISIVQILLVNYCTVPTYCRFNCFSV
jgi:hypothetical protein